MEIKTIQIKYWVSKGKYEFSGIMSPDNFNVTELRKKDTLILGTDEPLNKGSVRVTGYDSKFHNYLTEIGS